MTFIEGDKLYGLIVGIWMLLCIGGGFMAIMVTSEQRSSEGKGPWGYIFGMGILAIVGWMIVDFFFLPEFAEMPVADFLRAWIEKRTG
jgi:drug/metabolite transporter (DMT)-like permease